MTEEVTTTAVDSTEPLAIKSNSGFDYIKGEALSHAKHLWIEVRSRIAGAENDVAKMTTEIVDMAKKFEAYLKGL